MKRRAVMTSAALGAAWIPSFGFAQSGKGTARRGPTLLTVTGAIARTNRGPSEAAFDQLMHKHKVTFDKAYTFDFATIAALPGVTIRPTLEYDEKVHTLAGPLLTDLVNVAAPSLSDSSRLLLRAIDGYALVVPVASVRRYRFIVADRPRRPADPARRPRAFVGGIRRRPIPGHGSQTGQGALCVMPLGALSHRCATGLIACRAQGATRRAGNRREARQPISRRRVRASAPSRCSRASARAAAACGLRGRQAGCRRLHRAMRARWPGVERLHRRARSASISAVQCRLFT